jgi:hypothetical protein
VASGTLLSVGAIDPRGKTERSLETPRLFFSQTDTTGQAYFKPSALPAVTVHQTLETETVKLSDSIDPRRAKTMPRLERVALEQAGDTHPESAAPVVLSGPGSSLNLAAYDAKPPWNQAEYDAYPASLASDHDGQIHASLSPFREQVEESFDLAGVPTRAEPLAGRRGVQEEVAVKKPDPSAVPTQRDLPAHRVEASEPPPRAAEVGAGPDSEARGSEVARPTTASIAAEEPERRPAWLNYQAFVAALLFAVVNGYIMNMSCDHRSEP